MDLRKWQPAVLLVPILQGIFDSHTRTHMHTYVHVEEKSYINELQEGEVNRVLSTSIHPVDNSMSDC